MPYGAQKNNEFTENKITNFLLAIEKGDFKQANNIVSNKNTLPLRNRLKNLTEDKRKSILENLAIFLENSKIENIDLSDNCITDNNISLLLAAIAKNPFIKILALESNDFNNQKNILFYSLAQCTYLTEIYLGDNPFLSLFMFNQDIFHMNSNHNWNIFFSLSNFEIIDLDVSNSIYHCNSINKLSYLYTFLCNNYTAELIIPPIEVGNNNEEIEELFLKLYNIFNKRREIISNLFKLINTKSEYPDIEELKVKQYEFEELEINLKYYLKPAAVLFKKNNITYIHPHVLNFIPKHILDLKNNTGHTFFSQSIITQNQSFSEYFYKLYQDYMFSRKCLDMAQQLVNFSGEYFALRNYDFSTVTDHVNDISAIAYILRKNQVKKIELVSCGLNNFDFEILFKGIKHAHLLEMLDISCNNIGDLGALCLAEIVKKGDRLKIINIDKCNITDQGYSHLLKAGQQLWQRSNALENFSLAGNKISNNLRQIEQITLSNKAFSAVKVGNINFLKDLYENKSKKINLFEIKDHYHNNLLHHAAMAGQLEVTKYFTSINFLLDARNTENVSALLWAAVYGHLNIIQFLLKKDKSLSEAKNIKHNNLFLLAVINGRMNVVNWLLENNLGLYAKDEHFRSAILLASLHNQIEMMELFYKRNNRCVFEKDIYGFTCLHLAAYEGHYNLVQKLLDWGADINAKGNDRELPQDLAKKSLEKTTYFEKKQNLENIIYLLKSYTKGEKKMEKNTHVPNDLKTNQVSLAKEFLNFHQQTQQIILQLKNYVATLATNPEEHGLAQAGISHAIVKANHEKREESELLKSIKKFNNKRLGNYTEEKDKALHFYALHWCSLFDYAQVGAYLKSKAFDLAVRSEKLLTPLQTAALVGSRNFFNHLMREEVKFSETTIQYKTLQGETHTFSLNELHLAIIGNQINIVRDIYKLFKEKGAGVNTEIAGIGNLLHLIVYVGLAERNELDNQIEDQTTDVKEVNAVTMLQLILQYSDHDINQLLCQSKGNHEHCTPLVLAAKYGLVDLVHALITYLKLHVEESNGLEQITQAFYMAAEERQLDVMELYLHYYGFKPNSDHPFYNDTMKKLNENTKDLDYKRAITHIQNASRTSYINRFNKPNPISQPYENLVLSGGGGKGFALPFLLQEFKKQCQLRSDAEINDSKKLALLFDNVKRVAGTSAGAIFAMALAIGCSLEDIEKKLEYDFAEFLESEEIKQVVKQLGLENASHKTMLDNILKRLEINLNVLKSTYENVSTSQHFWLTAGWQVVKQPVSLYNEITRAVSQIKKLNKEFNGFSPGHTAYKFLKELLKERDLQEDTTFGELAVLVKNQPKQYKHLHVVVTNLTQGNFEVLSSENSLYKNYLIIDAVRASMSYPIVFKPHQLRFKEGTKIQTIQDEYVDGGVLRNYAIDEFDFKKYTETDIIGDSKHPNFNEKTLGFRFHVDESPEREANKQQASIVSRLFSFISVYSQAETLLGKYMDREYYRSIIINTGKITTFTFKKLTAAEKAELKNRSEEAVTRYFSQIKLNNQPASTSNNNNYQPGFFGSNINQPQSTQQNFLPSESQSNTNVVKK